MFWPCETRTSTCRNLATISSGLYRFLAITVLLDVKDIPQVGPLQWGWITPSCGVGTCPHQFFVASDGVGRRWPSHRRRHRAQALAAGQSPSGGQPVEQFGRGPGFVDAASYADEVIRERDHRGV